MYSSEAFLMHLYLILKISNYVEFASLLEIYTFLLAKKRTLTFAKILSYSYTIFQVLGSGNIRPVCRIDN
jgi:hypothetical protein